MREGMKEHILLPKIVMARIPAQIAKQIVDKPEDSPFYKPFKTYRNSEAAEELAKTGEADGRPKRGTRDPDGVIPAYRQFKEFFEKEYLPACYDRSASGRCPTATRPTPSTRASTPRRT